MKSIKSTLIAFSVGMLSFAAISTSANENEERNVMVQVHKTDDSELLVDLEVDGNAEVFSLPELEVGESRNIVTESGKNIYVSRSENGLSVSIDGEDIDLPHVGGDMQAHFLKGTMPLHKDTSNDIQVIGDLTEEQITIIKDGFAAAGVEKEINFTSGHEMKFFFSGDDKQLKHVKKWVSKGGDNVKIIRLKDGDSQLHVERKVIILEAEDTVEN